MLIRLMDGQHSLWSTAETCCEVPEDDVVEILDIVHVSSYVWKAAKVFHSHREHQEAFAKERLLRILQGDTKGVIMGLRQMATRHNLRGRAATKKRLEDPHRMLRIIMPVLNLRPSTFDLRPSTFSTYAQRALM